MKLTKLQRYTAYCMIEEEILSGYFSYGFCIYIEDMFGLKDEEITERIIQKYFPELWNKRPKKLYQKETKILGALWFEPFSLESNSRRKNIIKQCIEETHP